MNIRRAKKLMMQAAVAVMLSVTSFAPFSPVGDYAVVEAAAAKLASPGVSKKAGTYTNKVTVTIKNKASKGKLYYTTNGKTPTTKSKIYKKALTFKKTTVLKVRCISGSQKSAVVTRKYVIKKADLQFTPVDENEDTTYSKVSKYINALAYQTTASLSKTDQEVCKKAVAVLQDLIDDSMSTEEKAKVIHDYIINQTAYDQENYLKGTIPQDSYSVKGVLLNKKAVCQGYAETYYMLLHLLDIPCKIIVSTTHAWNLVKLSDGKWYHVDCTWDDPVMANGEQTLRYDYLFTDDTIMRQQPDHQWVAKDYPVCDGTKYLYYAYGDGKLASVSDFADAVRKAYEEGKHELTVLYPEKGNPNLDVVYEITGATSIRYIPAKRMGNYTIFTVMW